MKRVASLAYDMSPPVLAELERTVELAFVNRGGTPAPEAAWAGALPGCHGILVGSRDQVTPEMRQNIRERGAEMLEKLRQVADEFPDCITKVQGTGLLVSAELDPDRFTVVGFGQVEEYCRTHGVGVIHGGANALRYTPHFRLTSEEIDLICDNLRAALTHFSA